MQVEWDAAKNAHNIVKHGVSFDFAGRAFDRHLVRWPDVRTDYGEERWRGLADIEGRVYFVAWTMRGSDTVRLISARRANDRETKRYRTRTAEAQSRRTLEDRANEHGGDSPG